MGPNTRTFCDTSSGATAGQNLCLHGYLAPYNHAGINLHDIGDIDRSRVQFSEGPASR